MQTQTTIYRMEDAEHRGPFNADIQQAESETGERAMWRHVPWISVKDYGLQSNDDSHPHHFKDVLGMDDDATYFNDLLGIEPITGHWLVGCDSLPEFLHWFPTQSLADFQAAGMRLDIYQCPNNAVKRGRWQVMFDPAKAKLIKSEPLTVVATEAKERNSK